MSLSRTLQSSHLGSKSEVASKCWAGHQVLGFPRSTVNLGTVLCAECYMGQSLSTREEAVDRFIEMCVWEKEGGEQKTGGRSSREKGRERGGTQS